jgi:subtilisin family serine protease
MLLPVLLLSPALAASGPTPEGYVENEIIVKFRGNVAEAVQTGLANGGPAKGLKLSNSLDELNKRYKLKKAKCLVKNFRENRGRVKALLKKDEALLSKKERHIVKRLKRAPKGARVPDLSGIYKLELELGEGQSLEEAVAEYGSDLDIEYAELNYIVKITASPNDPLYPIQWPLNNTGQMYPESGRYNHPPGTPDSDIDAPEAWDLHTGSSEIIVAVVDTGVDYTHRDLDDNMWVNEAELAGVAGVDDDGNGYIDDIYGYNFLVGNGDPMDDHGHGTHCSGIIAAEGNNGLDIAGVCWNARIMALKFLNWQGSGETADAVPAFYYAVEHGADVISNSWGGGGYSQSMRESIDYAHSQGVITIASAGNDNTDSPQYPAYYEHMIAVAATNSKDQKAPFSNYGDWVDIAAPGVDILSLRAGGTSAGTVYDAYTTIASGTSMACPHISGACALLLAVNPTLTNEDVYDILTETVDPIADGICLADGRLNLFSAVLAAIPSQGRIILDQDYYACSGGVSIFLYDYDLQGSNTHAITITTSGGDSETVVLTERTPPVGFFAGTIATAPDNPNTEDGLLQLSHGELITATYQDTDDGTGNQATATDTAIADCEEPVISNVRIGFPGREPRVRFETDEPTSVQVLAGLACGGPYIIEASNRSLATSHTIKLNEVAPETSYFFVIEATDAAGNKATDTNHGRCYTFTTATAPSDISVPTQCPTIQDAIDNSWDGGTVWVADGIYTGDGNRDIDFRARAITVKSENGPEHCIIDCNGTEADSHRGFHFHSGEDANSVLDGFTIKNGYVAGSWYVGIGGAISCEGSGPTITNCIFTKNSAGWDGGGINNINSNPTITNCTFAENLAVGNDGGAINNEISGPTIRNCTFNGNSAYDWGGAIRNIIDSYPTIINCSFAGNSSDDGGAMFYYDGSNPTITHCTFAGNSARNGNALACESDVIRNNIQITNCIFSDGGSEIHNNDNSATTVRYSNIEGGWPGEGNIDADPCFIESGYWADANDTDILVGPNHPNTLWVNGDYHLLRTSPCVDAGTDVGIYTDIEGNIRPFDFPQVDNNGDLPDFDMGAYELIQTEASMVLMPRMLNCNSRGKWVLAYITMTDESQQQSVGVDMPAIAEPMNVQSEHVRVLGAPTGPVRLLIAFDRLAFCEGLTDTGLVEVTVVGHLTTGRYFKATDTIKIKAVPAINSLLWLKTKPKG